MNSTYVYICLHYLRQNKLLNNLIITHWLTIAVFSPRRSTHGSFISSFSAPSRVSHLFELGAIQLYMPLILSSAVGGRCRREEVVAWLGSSSSSAKAGCLQAAGSWMGASMFAQVRGDVQFSQQRKEIFFISIMMLLHCILPAWKKFTLGLGVIPA